MTEGTNGTVSRHHAGSLPAAGRWVRLVVPAREVDLESVEVSGVKFAVSNGRASWGPVGKLSPPLVPAIYVAEQLER